MGACVCAKPSSNATEINLLDGNEENKLDEELDVKINDFTKV